MAKKDAVEKTEQGVVPNYMTPDDAGSGFEEMGPDDIATPFIAILQSGSPQINPKDEAFIKGAGNGDFINNVSQQVYNGEEGIIVIPCAYERVALEWKEGRKGLKAIHPHDTPLWNDCEKDEKGKDVLPSGNVLSMTCQYYCLLIDPTTGGAEAVLIAMSSTGLKISRRWNKFMTSEKVVGADGMTFTPPMFGTYWTLTTVSESNDDGTWNNWKVDKLSLVDNEEHYKLAKQFHIKWKEGRVKVQTEGTDDLPF